jgi:hypothetical protein
LGEAVAFKSFSQEVSDALGAVHVSFAFEIIVELRAQIIVQ